MVGVRNIGDEQSGEEMKTFYQFISEQDGLGFRALQSYFVKSVLLQETAHFETDGLVVDPEPYMPSHLMTGSNDGFEEQTGLRNDRSGPLDHLTMPSGANHRDYSQKRMFTNPSTVGASGMCIEVDEFKFSSLLQSVFNMSKAKKAAHLPNSEDSDSQDSDLEALREQQ